MELLPGQSHLFYGLENSELSGFSLWWCLHCFHGTCGGQTCFLLPIILVCFLTSGSLLTYKYKWRSSANIRPKHFWHQYLKESHSLALEMTFFSSSCLCFNETSEISILWRCGPLIHHVEFGNTLLSSLVKYQRIVHPVLVNRLSKRPCLYYSYVYATFCLLIGDILFQVESWSRH